MTGITLTSISDFPAKVKRERQIAAARPSGEGGCSAEDVEVMIGGMVIRMLDGLIAVELALLLGNAGQVPEPLAGEQQNEKHGDDNQRHRRMMLLFHA